MQVSVATSGPQVCGHLAWWARSRSGVGPTRIIELSGLRGGRARGRAQAHCERAGAVPPDSWAGRSCSGAPCPANLCPSVAPDSGVLLRA